MMRKTFHGDPIGHLCGGEEYIDQQIDLRKV